MARLIEPTQWADGACLNRRSIERPLSTAMDELSVHARVHGQEEKARGRPEDVEGATWCEKLAGTELVGLGCAKQCSRDPHPNIWMETAYGNVRLSGGSRPVSVCATDESGSVVADSAEALASLLSLPESGHSLSHWYAGSGSSVGRPAPIVRVVKVSFTGVPGASGHISGSMQWELIWTAQMRLPAQLNISLTTEVGKLMWDCSK
jgi:hypothetical protein